MIHRKVALEKISNTQAGAAVVALEVHRRSFLIEISASFRSLLLTVAADWTRAVEQVVFLTLEIAKMCSNCCDVLQVYI